MKKFIYPLLLLIALSINSNLAFATNDKVKTELTAEQRLELNRITSRVEEIKAMDKSKLSKEERKELRKELKEMKQKARLLGGGGLFLSIGAIVLIIVLLIIIL